MPTHPKAARPITFPKVRPELLEPTPPLPAIPTYTRLTNIRITQGSFTHTFQRWCHVLLVPYQRRSIEPNTKRILNHKPYLHPARMPAGCFNHILRPPHRYDMNNDPLVPGVPWPEHIPLLPFFTTDPTRRTRAIRGVMAQGIHYSRAMNWVFEAQYNIIAGSAGAPTEFVRAWEQRVLWTTHPHAYVQLHHISGDFLTLIGAD